MRKLQLFYGLILAALLAAAAPVMAQTGSPDPPPGAPGVWTERSCQGEDALVVQAPDESGAGVTLSLVDPWGCAKEPEHGLLFVEPWSPGSHNADSACWVPNWDTAEVFAEVTELWNGSLWVLGEDVTLHNLVVPCTDVTDVSELGLNPYEHQIAFDRMSWTFARATELVGDTALYCRTADDLITPYLCGAHFQGYDTLSRLFSGR